MITCYLLACVYVHIPDDSCAESDSEPECDGREDNGSSQSSLCEAVDSEEARYETCDSGMADIFYCSEYSTTEVNLI